MSSCKLFSAKGTKIQKRKDDRKQSHGDLYQIVSYIGLVKKVILGDLPALW
jgi:hypothetical protein